MTRRLPPLSARTLPGTGAAGDVSQTIAAATGFQIADDFLFGVDLTQLAPFEI